MPAPHINREHPISSRRAAATPQEHPLSDLSIHLGYTRTHETIQAAIGRAREVLFAASKTFTVETVTFTSTTCS